MSKKRITYIHIFIWLFAIFANLPYSAIGTDLTPKLIVSYIISFLYLMLVFYIFYLLLVPAFLNKKKLPEFFGISFLTVLVMPFFGYTILFFSRALFEGTFHDFYRGYSVKMHMSGYYPVLTAAVFGSFFGVIISWFTTMNQKAELDKQRLAMELDLLKSKLNPHFLFNTLNNIDSLIHTDPKEASEALIRLSDIMRYLTYETAYVNVELEREVSYIQNLIELHRLRIKSPDDIRLTLKGDMTTKVAPAIFIPLIENGFKFASFKNGKPALEIHLTAEAGIINFSISNYFEKSNGISSTHSGTGIINLKKRLELTYPGKYLLNMNSEDSKFLVNLTIDTNAA